MPPKTEQHNLGDRYARIPLTEFPKTFRDAVTVVRNLDLGTRYLWIDCFCIIQGDNAEARADFERECARMYSTFANAVVTICGPGAGNVDAGFLDPRNGLSADASKAVEVELSIGDKPVTISIVEQREGELGLRKDFDSDLGSALSLRAWIVQERLLSSRILYLGRNQMYMECASADFYEGLAYPMPALSYPMSKPTLRQGTRRELWEQWRQIIAEYSTCNITDGNDWLPALSGTANRSSSFLGVPYHAGLWGDNLATELTWRRSQRLHGGAQPRPLTEHRVRKSATVTPPSWSWASCEYGTSFYLDTAFKDRSRQFVEILEIFTPPVGEDPFGQVDFRSATLRLKGLCQAAIVSTDVPVEFQRHPEDPQFSDGVYSLDGTSIAEMVRDDPLDYRIGQEVTVVLVAGEYYSETDADNGYPSDWAALVLRHAGAAERGAGLPNAVQYVRIGLMYVNPFHSSLDYLGGPGYTRWLAESAWTWMQSGEYTELEVR